MNKDDSFPKLTMYDHRFPALVAAVGIIAGLIALFILDGWFESSRPDPLLSSLFLIFLAVFGLLRAGRRKWVFSRFPTQLQIRCGTLRRSWRDIQLPEQFLMERIAKTIVFRRDEASPPIEVAHFGSARTAILRHLSLVDYLSPESPEEFFFAFPNGNLNRNQSFVSRLSNSPMTTLLILLNVVASVTIWMLGEKTLMAGALRVSAVKQGEYYRIFTSQFLHANTLHLLMNMFALSSLGSQVEKIVGPRKFLVIYFVSGFCASTWSLYFIGEKWLVGASGAIFGLLGALGAYIYWGRAKLPPGVYLPTSKQLSTDLILNGMLSLLPFVSFSAHFGGFVSGLVVTTILHSTMPPSGQRTSSAL